MFSSGPGGRRHGSGLPQRTETIERLHAKDAYRHKSKAERRAKPDIEDLVGEGPGVVRDDVEDPATLPPEFWQAADEYAEAHIEAQNELAKSQGIGVENWNTDRATETEYYGAPSGLPGHVLAAEKKRLTDQMRGMNRDDVDAIGAQQAWVEDLWMDWRDLHGAEYEKAEVADAAVRVKARYEAEGSLNALRKIALNRAEFLDDVWIEVGSVVPAHLRTDHGGGRTQGLGNEYGSGHASDPEPERSKSTMADELNADKRRTNYY